MSGDTYSGIDRLIQNTAVRRFARAARLADKTDLPELRRQRSTARKLKHHVETLLFKAEARLATPLLGDRAVARPHDADWSWRPDLWCGPLAVPGIASAESKAKMGPQVAIFHDCVRSELTLRQVRNTREADLAPFALRMDVFRFDGSYLSLAIDLPDSAAHGLKRRHLIRFETIVEMERPLEIFARLNIKHGPNTEQVVRELPLNDDIVGVEFDLAYTQLNEKRAERMWLDLIFEGPQMNQVVLRDMTFSRRPRAEL